MILLLLWWWWWLWLLWGWFGMFVSMWWWFGRRAAVLFILFPQDTLSRNERSSIDLVTKSLIWKSLITMAYYHFWLSQCYVTIVPLPTMHRWIEFNIAILLLLLLLLSTYKLPLPFPRQPHLLNQLLMLLHYLIHQRQNTYPSLSLYTGSFVPK